MSAETRLSLSSFSGLDALQAMMDGRLPPPPAAVTARVRLVEAAFGRVVFEGDPQADFDNPLGTIHGGWTALILDSAMACAAHSTLEAGEAYTTVEFKLTFARPLRAGVGLVRAEGLVIQRGRRIILSEGRLTGPDGKLIAHGVETCLAFPAQEK